MYMTPCKTIDILSSKVEYKLRFIVIMLFMPLFVCLSEGKIHVLFLAQKEIFVLKFAIFGNGGIKCINM